MRIPCLCLLACCLLALLPLLGAGCQEQPSQPHAPNLLSVVPVVSVDPWTYQGDPGWRLVTPHYVIYTTIHNQDVRNRLPLIMEGALVQYRELLPTVEPSGRPMECYVFEERRQWNDFTTQITGHDAPIYLQIRRGGYTVGDRYVAYYIGMQSTSSVTSHEGWHQFLARHFIGRLPPFLEEGLACTFEGVSWEGDPPRPEWNTSRNRIRARELRDAINNNHCLPLEKLMTLHAGEVVNQSSAQVEAFYAQCWAFARFMREADGGRYRPALERWLSETAAGICFDPTGSHARVTRPWNPAGIHAMVEHYLEMSLSDIQKKYDAFCLKIARDENGPPSEP